MLVIEWCKWTKWTIDWGEYSLGVCLSSSNREFAGFWLQCTLAYAMKGQGSKTLPANFHHYDNSYSHVFVRIAKLLWFLCILLLFSKNLGSWLYIIGDFFYHCRLLVGILTADGDSTKYEKLNYQLLFDEVSDNVFGVQSSSITLCGSYRVRAGTWNMISWVLFDCSAVS